MRPIKRPLTPSIHPTPQCFHLLFRIALEPPLFHEISTQWLQIAPAGNGLTTFSEAEDNVFNLMNYHPSCLHYQLADTDTVSERE
jgi:hypothetical protein